MGILLSSYFYGFCMTQLFGGYLSGRFGGKHVFGVATLISTIATLLCPIAARFNLYLFIALRTVLGLASVRKTQLIVHSRQILPTVYEFIVLN